MSALRFAAIGGSLFENIAGRMVQRDPAELQALAEQWMRDGVEAQERGDHRRAKLYGHDALQAQLALSTWERTKPARGFLPFRGAR